MVAFNGQSLKGVLFFSVIYCLNFMQTGGLRESSGFLPEVSGVVMESDNFYKSISNCHNNPSLGKKIIIIPDQHSRSFPPSYKT